MTTTSEEVWQLLRELIESQKETERRFQEAERRFQETERLLKEESQEAERRFQETERLLKEESQETERRFQETDRRFQETERILKQQSQKTDEQIGKLGNRLGEFVEWQIRPSAVALFKARGIEVHELQSEVSVQRGDEGIEIDLLVVNDTDAILIEVKSKLTRADVDEHLERLAKFKRFMPRYRDVRALGAVGGMVVPKDVASYAYRQGLFVIAQSGENIVILNDDKFKPRAW
jgi:hypothetical protein